MTVGACTWCQHTASTAVGCTNHHAVWGWVAVAWVVDDRPYTQCKLLSSLAHKYQHHVVRCTTPCVMYPCSTGKRRWTGGKQGRQPLASSATARILVASSCKCAHVAGFPTVQWVRGSVTNLLLVREIIAVALR